MKGKDRLINILLVIARIIFGFTFVFSGFVKAVDPIGFAYKIEDYLISFQLFEIIPLALTFAVVLILIEFMLGVFILLGLYRKLSSILAVLFMVVMTPLTLYIALANPVEDCGCFGDAVVISNWSTFYKNIVLSILALILALYHNNIKPLFSAKRKHYVATFVFLFSLLFCLYNILYLPLIDFRPYKVGVNIPEQMESDLSNGDVYENIYIYEKGGVEKEFTEENFPWDDSTWTFVDYQSKLVKEGEQPQIDGFYITSYNRDAAGQFIVGEDVTDDILSKPIVLFVVSRSLTDAREKGMQQIVTLANHAEAEGLDLYIATSTQSKEIEQWYSQWGNPLVNFAQMDELTLKTIIRSNPGLLLLNRGTIMGKWSSRNLPSASELDEIIAELEIE